MAQDSKDTTDSLEITKGANENDSNVQETLEKSFRANPLKNNEFIIRFDLNERFVHWVTAILFLTCLVTGIALKSPPLMVLFGGRTGLRITHIFAGFLLPFPLVIGVLAAKKESLFRKDIRLLNRWTNSDFEWLKTWGRKRGLESHKFNGGQKANASFIAGTVIIMLLTGIVMTSYNLFPINFRTGATFFHNVFFYLALFAITGHITYAMLNLDSLKSMITGKVSITWAKRHSKMWVKEDDELPN